MKAPVTLLLALSTGLMAHGQSLTIKDTDGNVVNGTQLNSPGDSYALDLGLALDVTQSTGSAAMVNVRRYELDVLAGTQNYFCWYECYAPQAAGDIPVWQAVEPVSIGASEVFDGFHAYYRPQELSGNSCFRYVWFMAANENDSAWVDICFSAAPVGINEASVQAARLEISPNPSSGDVNFQFDGQTTGRRTLVLHNTLGERVSTLPINGTQRKITLADGQLASGVWFASVEVEGRPVATRRFVITGH